MTGAPPQLEGVAEGSSSSINADELMIPSAESRCAYQAQCPDLETNSG